MEEFSTFFQKLNQHIKDVPVGPIRKVYTKYSQIDKERGTKFFLKEVLESILWVAETTKDKEKVRSCVECFLLKEMEEIFSKYSGEVLKQVFMEVEAEIMDSVDIQKTKKYINWVNNGYISKLLKFMEEFPVNGNIALKQEILSILDIKPEVIDVFNPYLSSVARKRIPLERKLEILNLVVDSLISDKKDYPQILLSRGFGELKKTVESVLKIRLNNYYSLRCAIKFLDDMKKDPTIQLLYEKALQFRSIRRWFMEEPTAKEIIEEMRRWGFDVDLFLGNKHFITQRKSNGIFSEDWRKAFRRLVIKIVGNKKNDLLPRISIPDHSPGSIFSKIRENYFRALEEEDKSAAVNVLKFLKGLIESSYKKRKIPRSVEEVVKELEGLRLTLTKGIPFTYKGAKVFAKVWKRRVPEDFYDSNLMWCCWFLPQGERGEIPLLFLDPKTTLLQFYVQGVENPIGVSFLYAGRVDDQPSILVDSWEGGAFIYSILGQEKTKEFALEAMKKFARKCGAKKLLIFANAAYSRGKEFRNYLKSKGYEIRRLEFCAIDAEDKMLQKYSRGNKHHTTDAFGINKPLQGEIEAFVFEF